MYHGISACPNRTRLESVCMGEICKRFTYLSPIRYGKDLGGGRRSVWGTCEGPTVLVFYVFYVDI